MNKSFYNCVNAQCNTLRLIQTIYCYLNLQLDTCFVCGFPLHNAHRLFCAWTRILTSLLLSKPLPNTTYYSCSILSKYICNCKSSSRSDLLVTRTLRLLAASFAFRRSLISSAITATEAAIFCAPFVSCASAVFIGIGELSRWEAIPSWSKMVWNANSRAFLVVCDCHGAKVESSRLSVRKLRSRFSRLTSRLNANNSEPFQASQILLLVNSEWYASLNAASN